MAIITTTGAKLPDLPTEMFEAGPYAVVYETTTMGDDKRYWFAFSFLNELAYVPKAVAEAAGIVDLFGYSADFICPQNSYASLGGMMLYDPQTDTWGIPPEDVTNSIRFLFLALLFEDTNDGYSGNFVAWTNSDIKKATSADFDNLVFEMGSEVAIHATPSDLKEQAYRASKMQILPLADAARKVSKTSGGKNIDAIVADISAVEPLQPVLDELAAFYEEKHIKPTLTIYEDDGEVWFIVPDRLAQSTEVVFVPTLTTIQRQWFQRDSHVEYGYCNLLIKEAYFPVATGEVPWLTAQRLLEKVVAPKATEIGSSAFGGCTSLVEIQRDWLPEVTNISMWAFGGCKNLIRADFLKLETFSLGVFYNSGLKTLVLRNPNKVVTWAGTSNDNFGGSPIGNGKGIILVPAALGESYRTGNWGEWTKHRSLIFDIEDYSVDGTLDGDIDWDRVDAYIATL